MSEVEDTLSQERWVSSAVNRVTRNTNLSWSHHLAVAPLDTPEEQAKFLEIAERDAWDRAHERPGRKEDAGAAGH
jgi:hypothetical protein